MRRGYADTSSGQMHYREMGEGEPLILIHQALRSSLEYRRVMPLLADSRRVIAVDLMGYGDSDLTPSPLDVADHARHLREFTDNLGLAGFVVGGHHTGANVALEYAASYPDAVRALVLSGPAVVVGDEERDQLVRKMSAIEYPTAQADGSHLLTIWREGLVSSFGVPRLPADDPQLLADFFIEQIKVGPRRKEAHVAAFSHDAIDRIPYVKAPTLLMVGKQDMWACARGAELAAAASNGAELVEFDMAGEMPRLDAEHFATTIASFLAKRRRSRVIR